MDIIAGGALGVNIASFAQRLRLENPSPRIQETYAEATRQFAKLLAGQGMLEEVAHIHREHVKASISYLSDGWKPALAPATASGAPRLSSNG